MVGMTMTSTTVGITIVATVIARHINHGHDKHGRGIPKAGLYLYFACLYDYYYYCATRATKTTSTVQQQIAKPARPISGKDLAPHMEASKSPSSVITQLRTGKIGFNAYLHIRNIPGIDSPSCICGYRLQSIEHVLLYCRKYYQLRRNHLGTGHKTLGVRVVP